MYKIIADSLEFKNPESNFALLSGVFRPIAKGEYQRYKTEILKENDVTIGFSRQNTGSGRFYFFANSFDNSTAKVILQQMHLYNNLFTGLSRNVLFTIGEELLVDSDDKLVIVTLPTKDELNFKQLYQLLVSVIRDDEITPNSLNMTHLDMRISVAGELTFVQQQEVIESITWQINSRYNLVDRIVEYINRSEGETNNCRSELVRTVLDCLPPKFIKNYDTNEGFSILCDVISVGLSDKRFLMKQLKTCEDTGRVVIAAKLDNRFYSDIMILKYFNKNNVRIASIRRYELGSRAGLIFIIEVQKSCNLDVSLLAASQEITNIMALNSGDRIEKIFKFFVGSFISFYNEVSNNDSMNSLVDDDIEAIIFNKSSQKSHYLLYNILTLFCQQQKPSDERYIHIHSLFTF